MSVDVLSYFSGLDELVQVIYQGLMGEEGRWWRGSQSAADILQIVGSKPSEQLVETFADQLADAIRSGDVHIGGLTPEKGAEIKLTLGSAKKLLDIPLVELSHQDAASFATSVLFEIAKEAQSRKCQLHSSPYALPVEKNHSSSLAISKPAHVAKPAAPITAKATTSKTPTKHDTQSSGGRKSQDVQSPGERKAREEIKALKAELAKKQTKAEPPPDDSNSKPVRPPKGASLANPNKRARKYQALEFASDDDD